MARGYAKVLCSLWTDEDFVRRSPEAQRMFLLILSQAKLSFCGAIDYVPSRWARLAPGMTADDVDIVVDELERHRYVFVDRDAHELLVRTFVRNDGILKGRWTMTKAMWNAWESISSPILRLRLIEELSDDAWTRENVTVPEAAKTLRQDVIHRRRTAMAPMLRATTPTTPTDGVVDIATLRKQVRGRAS